MRKITSENERRLHPRIIQQLPIKVAVNGYDFATTTQDVSCLGAYCHVDKYVPPFTKVMVKLGLPIKSTTVGRGYSLECKGVVVRTEDEVTGGFNIAVFFNHITSGQKQIISQYISQLLSQGLPVAP